MSAGFPWTELSCSASKFGMNRIAPAFLRKNEFRLFADYFENAVHIAEFLTELEKSFCLQEVAEV